MRTSASKDCGWAVGGHNGLTMGQGIIQLDFTLSLFTVLNAKNKNKNKNNYIYIYIY
jgi:hypothetical protein